MLSSREATAEEIEKTGLVHRVYLPEGAGGDTPRPMVVMVHGRAGSSQVMWVFSKALERLKPIVVSPQANIPDIKDGFSWWPVHAPLSADASAALRAERLNEVERGVLLARDFIDRAVTHYNADPSRLYIIGFSQGGALSGTLSLMEPERFRGVGILSGFIPYAVLQEPGLVHPSVRAHAAKLPEYFVFHGTSDPVLPVHRAVEAKKWLEDAGANVTFFEEDVTHKVGAAGIRALTEWFERRFAEDGA